MRNICLAVLNAGSLLALGSCGHRSSSPSQPARTPANQKAPARPSPETSKGGPLSPTPSPSPSASSPSSPSIAPLPPPPKKVTRLPPDAAPRILNVAVSETTVQPGDHVRGRVVTTSNVASVEARIGGYAVSLIKTGVGRFELTYTVGPLPWFIRGNFTMQVIAHNTRGDTTTREIPLTVR
jgi:hypothetical protein